MSNSFKSFKVSFEKNFILVSLKPFIFKKFTPINDIFSKNLFVSVLSFYKQLECGAKNPSIQKIKEFKKCFPTANTDEIFLT